MPHPRFDLIVFDLDGTLIDTAAEITAAVNDTLVRFDLPSVDEAQVRHWIGQGTRELLVQALAATGGTHAEVVRTSRCLPLVLTEFDRHYTRRCGTRSRPYPQVPETLQALRARGVKLAVVSNKERRYAALILDAHGLSHLFECVVGGDTLPTKKPDPAGVQSCIAQCDTTRQRALFVGDSSIDVATARNADVQVWALPHGYNMGQPIAASAPDRVIDDVSALLS